MVVGWKQITFGEHRGPRKTRQDSSSLGSAARRLTLSRYVSRLKPRCGSLALSVMWYVLTVSQVGDMARFEWNLLSVNIHSKSYKVTPGSRSLALPASGRAGRRAAGPRARRAGARGYP